jgi:hypothetical protein
VILKAMAGSLKSWETVEIIGVSDRTMMRWREPYQQGGNDGLDDRHERRPSPKRIPLKTAEEVLQLYREKYFDFNVRHFHEKPAEEHGVQIMHGDTWVKTALSFAVRFLDHLASRPSQVLTLQTSGPDREGDILASDRASANGPAK